MELNCEEVVSKVVKDGSIVTITEGVGVLVRKEDYFNQTISSIVRIKNINDKPLQNGYINRFWQDTLNEHSQPKKWLLNEFFVDVEIKIVRGIHFSDWSIARKVNGDIEKLVIESIFSPFDELIEGYDLCIEMEKTHLYEFRLHDIGKMIFSI